MVGFVEPDLDVAAVVGEGRDRETVGLHPVVLQPQVGRADRVVEVHVGRRCGGVPVGLVACWLTREVHEEVWAARRAETEDVASSGAATKLPRRNSEEGLAHGLVLSEDRQGCLTPRRCDARGAIPPSSTFPRRY